jgi:hypothetical protein
LQASSGNIFSLKERRQVRRSCAVGNICFQFIDEERQLAAYPLMERLIGIDLAKLKSTRRVLNCWRRTKNSRDSNLAECEVAERSDYRSTYSRAVDFYCIAKSNAIPGFWWDPEGIGPHRN